MRIIRAAFNTRSSSYRLFVGLGAAFIVVAGLLAMHTLNTDVGYPETSPSVIASAHSEPAAAAAGGAPPPSGHCPGDCRQGEMPDHSLMLMICVLALLAAVIIVLAPALLGRHHPLPSIVAHLEAAVRATPRPKPPSLLVLSISRT